MKISSNNDFTFCPNPENLRLLIPLAAQFFSCVFLLSVSFPFVLDLVAHPWIGLVPPALKLAKSLWRPLRQNQRGEMPAPSAIAYHGAMSLPLGCLLSSSPAWLPGSEQHVRLAQGSRVLRYCVLYCTTQQGNDDCFAGEGGDELWELCLLKSRPPGQWLSTPAPAVGFSHVMAAF